MKESGRTVKLVEKEDFGMLMEIHTKASGYKTKQMDTVNTYMLMVPNI